MVIIKSKTHLKNLFAKNQRIKNANMMGDNFRPVKERKSSTIKLDQILKSGKLKSKQSIFSNDKKRMNSKQTNLDKY